ncbi:MAG: hypothetical protein JXQ65_11685 [Candidatus Marinimicrobia bacterium]|nr:hypothetical protein [Candidatus Neomarinimicrobiota bacterium]
MKTLKVLHNFIYHHQLIQPNNKILLAVSGGIDSLVMSHYLKDYADRRKENIKLEAAYVKIDEVMLGDEHMDYLENYFKRLNIDFTILPGKVPVNVDFQCYTCARERRKQLCIYAIEKGFDSIAFGHILDDYLETGLMNMITSGHFQSLVPKDTLFEGKIDVIRPLLRFSKKQLRKYARENDIQDGKHKCNFETHNIRDDIRKLIRDTSKIHPNYEKSLRKIINKWNGMNI